MKREFYLREVGYEEFVPICARIRKRRPELDQTGKHRETVTKKRYFLIDQPIVQYGSLQELLDNIDDEHQKARCVWTRDCGIPVSDAKHSTLNWKEEHFAHILRSSENAESLLVDISEHPYDGRTTDTLEFGRDENFWVLRYFHILGRNLQFYQLRGVAEPMTRSSTLAAVGIYPGL